MSMTGEHTLVASNTAAEGGITLLMTFLIPKGEDEEEKEDEEKEEEEDLDFNLNLDLDLHLDFDVDVVDVLRSKRSK